MWWHTVTDAAILNYYDNDVDLFCHCNESVSLFMCLFCLFFKGHIFQGKPFSGCLQIWLIKCNMRYIL